TLRRSPGSSLFPYTTLFRSVDGPAAVLEAGRERVLEFDLAQGDADGRVEDTEREGEGEDEAVVGDAPLHAIAVTAGAEVHGGARSEEHTSELQSRENLVCRL